MTWFKKVKVSGELGQLQVNTKIPTPCGARRSKTGTAFEVLMGVADQVVSIAWPNVGGHQHATRAAKRQPDVAGLCGPTG